MPINLSKPDFKFLSGYRVGLGKGNHILKTCYSYFNRYQNQTEIIEKMMKDNRSGALKVFNIGISQGQEPLTHINSAFNIVKGTDRAISDVLDLSAVDILKETPIDANVAKSLDMRVVEYLKTLYRNPYKFHFATAFESLVPKMLNENQKQDVVLFNNVIQHIDFSNQKSVLDNLENLVSLVKKDGIFCFTCDVSAKPEIKSQCETLLDILNKRGFKEISKGVFKC